MMITDKIKSMYPFQTALFMLIIMMGLTGCKSQENLTDEHRDTSPQKKENPLADLFNSSEMFAKNFTGFMLYDPETDSMLYGVNESKYFTPASNTKLYTFYAGLKILPSTLPALEYVISGDSLIIWGTGDPTFLHPDYNSDPVINFLKNSSQDIYYSDAQYKDELLGPGWSWGDYQYYYSTEKSPFPMFGNVVEFKIEEISQTRIKPLNNSYAVNPAYFQSYIKTGSDQNEESLLFRGFNENEFHYQPEADTTVYTTSRPFHYTPGLITEMLSDTLGRDVNYISRKKPANTKKMYNSPANSVYKSMLYPSDNFIAEQLLLAITAEKNLRMNSQTAIEYVKSEYLQDLPDDPVWEDGSGLSRYNMFTPRTMVGLLNKIDDEFENDERMFTFFPAGGVRGTIDNWYANRENADQPYVFAKTGTLRNNHCLSGFIVTEKGKKLIFSFMNNHYTGSSSEVKTEMEKMLWYIYKNY